MTQTKIHISERFFTKAKRYFGSLESALKEALQNAYRATLPRLKGGEVCQIKVHWDLSKRALTVRDFGTGITDIGAALSIGLSNWGKGVEEEQDPAGMGLCGVMAFCEKLCFRSTFGSLTVSTKDFFERQEYREALLDFIDTGEFLNGEGTEITMVGISATDDNIYHALHDAARYHTAIRIEYQENDTPPKVVKNFLETENWKPRETMYRGYKVYDYVSPDRFGINYNRDQLLVVWHGQCIKVHLEYVKTKIRLPEVTEPVETSLKLPDFSSLAIVIDYGAAPVTPKLPDRDALIMDDKTMEFISGLFLPEFEERIQDVREGMIKAVDNLKSGKPEDRDAALNQLVPDYYGVHGCWRGGEDRLCKQLTVPLYEALYTHYVGLAKVRTMAPRDLSDGRNGSYCIDLVPFTELPAVLSDRIVLWSDPSAQGRVLEITNTDTNRFIIMEHGSYEAGKINWDKKDTVLENGFEVLPGVCTDIDTVVGPWSPRYDNINFKQTTVVIHLSKTIEELGWGKDGDVDGCQIHAPLVAITKGPVKLTLLTYDEYGDLGVALGDYSSRELAQGTDNIGGTPLSGIIAAGTHIKVPRLMVRLDDDMEPSDSIFVGPEDEIMKLTQVASSYESSSDAKGDDNMSTEEWDDYVTETWDDFRSSISGIPELDDAITELINKIRARVKVEGRKSIVSLGINLTKNVLTFRSSSGKTAKTKYR